MKKYVIFDQIKNGDGFTDILKSDTEEKALIEANQSWIHMSKNDQNRREVFDLAYVEIDEDGVPKSDYTPIKSFAR